MVRHRCSPHFFLQEEETVGIYSLGQLSINICDKLYFLTSANCLSKVKYSVKHILPAISVETLNSQVLIAGIQSLITLNVSLGTYVMNQVRA